MRLSRNPDVSCIGPADGTAAHEARLASTRLRASFKAILPEQGGLRFESAKRLAWTDPRRQRPARWTPQETSVILALSLTLFARQEPKANPQQQAPRFSVEEIKTAGRLVGL